MKRLLQHIFAFILSISCISCMENPDIDKEFVKEGIPVELRLDFVAPGHDNAIVTKGGDNHDISDVYIFIFDSEDGKPGILKSKLYTTELTKENKEIQSDKGTASSSNSTRVTTPIKTTTGESFIFAFANLSTAYAPAEYNVDGIMEQLDALEIGTDCYESMMNIKVPLADKDPNSLLRITDSYLLAGSYQKTGNYTRENTPVVINTSGTLSGGTIRMYRLDAMIDFKIISNVPNGGKFTPTYWRIYNVPLYSRLATTGYTTGEDYDGDSPTYSDPSTNYWNTPDMTLESNSANNYEFSFYLMENRKSPTAAGEALSPWEYRHRETMQPLSGSTTEGDTHSFLYAPEYATYVEIDGYFEGLSKYPFDGDPASTPIHNITARTSYRIHLGDFGSNVNGSGHTFDDFNTLRNYHYTYTITVKGVDQIIAEVKKEDEDLTEMETPGINGIVSYISDKAHLVDSHYETRSITIKKSDLDNWTEEDFQYLAQTCYGEYSGSKGTDNPKQDIYWVEFILTHKKGYNGGTWSYYDGKGTSTFKTAGRTNKGGGGTHPVYMSYQIAKDYTKKYKVPDDPVEGDYPPKLMYVNEFLEDLWLWKNNARGSNTDDNIAEKVYTIFIKENFYTNEDIAKFDRQKNVTATSDSYHWKDFCNQPPRSLYIGMNKQESSQSESLIMENICVVSQRSIQTVYNTDHKHTDLTSAWGVETVDETYGTISKFDILYVPADGRVYDRTPIEKDINRSNFAYDDEVQLRRDNGYFHQFAFLWNSDRIRVDADRHKQADPPINTEWKKYVNLYTHDDMADSKYYHAFFECLSRNRDENGDGYIDPKEVKWYLPAIFQYGDLFIGERGIEPEAGLYYGYNTWTSDRHYLSASLKQEFGTGYGGRSQFKMLAEEGFAYSDLGELPNGLYNIRCVRDMGVNGTTKYAEGETNKWYLLNRRVPPQSYVRVNQDTRTIDVTWLNDDSKRGYVQTELAAEHTERSDENQLYDKYQWSAGLVNRGPEQYTSNAGFSADEVAYGERTNTTMRTLTRAYLYPNDQRRVKLNASASPKEGWRAPNQKELMLLHFHANGFSTDRPNGGASDADHYAHNTKYWYTCRTVFSYGGVKANRTWKKFPSADWTKYTGAVRNSATGSATYNLGEWYIRDKTNAFPGSSPGDSYDDYRYTYCTLHGGEGFGLLFLDWYLDGNAATHSGGTLVNQALYEKYPNATKNYSGQLRLVAVRDLK